MRNNQISRHRHPTPGRRARIGIVAFVASTLALLTTASTTLAETRGGWGNWWLPPDHSVHGAGMDSLFNWIFWITMIIFVVVEIVLVVFLIKYRYREGHKGVFTHGNTRLEMTWTLAPAIILAVLALFSKKVWDNYRYSPTANDPNRAQVLVIGEQFQWNVIYPGPDGKFGRYLIYPRQTDERWQNPDGSDKPYMFQNARGPADLGPEAAIRAINAYIQSENPLGKDFSDPDGKDDSWVKQAGTRELVLPKGRPIEVVLSSKDVIHDFFLPNFRVKLDAVPGMRGSIYFTATKTTKERELSSIKTYTIDELIDAVGKLENTDLTAIVTEADKEQGATQDRRSKAWLFRDADGTIVRNEGALVDPQGDRAATVKRLKALGVKQVKAYMPGLWELVCEELCGANHYKMRGVVRILDSDEYDALKLDKPYAPASTAPPVALGTADAK